MFLDTGNIFLIPHFMHRVCLRWRLVSHDPSGSCDNSLRLTAGMFRPVQFSSGLPWWILMTSLILLMEQQSGVVYQLKCDNCDKIYIGETSRNLGTRYKGHTTGRHPGTAVGEHLDNTGHMCSLKEAKILDKEDHVSRRRIKEAIRIHHGGAELNRDTGLDIPAVIL